MALAGITTKSSPGQFAPLPQIPVQTGTTHQGIANPFPQQQYGGSGSPSRHQNRAHGIPKFIQRIRNLFAKPSLHENPLPIDRPHQDISEKLLKILELPDVPSRLHALKNHLDNHRISDDEFYRILEAVPHGQSVKQDSGLYAEFYLDMHSLGLTKWSNNDTACLDVYLLFKGLKQLKKIHDPEKFCNAFGNFAKLLDDSNETKNKKHEYIHDLHRYLHHLYAETVHKQTPKTFHGLMLPRLEWAFEYIKDPDQLLSELWAIVRQSPSLDANEFKIILQKMPKGRLWGNINKHQPILDEMRSRSGLMDWSNSDEHENVDLSILFTALKKVSSFAMWQDFAAIYPEILDIINRNFSKKNKKSRYISDFKELFFRIGAEKAGTTYPKGFSPDEVNLHLRWIIENNDDNTVILSKLKHFLECVPNISDDDFYYLIDRMPLGVSWGNIGEGTEIANAIQEHGLGQWNDKENWRSMDRTILFRALVKVSKISDPKKFYSYRKKVLQMIRKSNDFSDYNTKYQDAVLKFFALLFDLDHHKDLALAREEELARVKNLETLASRQQQCWDVTSSTMLIKEIKKTSLPDEPYLTKALLQHVSRFEIQDVWDDLKEKFNDVEFKRNVYHAICMARLNGKIRDYRFSDIVIKLPDLKEAYLDLIVDAHFHRLHLVNQEVLDQEIKKMGDTAFGELVQKRLDAYVDNGRPPVLNDENSGWQELFNFLPQTEVNRIKLRLGQDTPPVTPQTRADFGVISSMNELQDTVSRAGRVLPWDGKDILNAILQGYYEHAGFSLMGNQNSRGQTQVEQWAPAFRNGLESGLAIARQNPSHGLHGRLLLQYWNISPDSNLIDSFRNRAIRIANQDKRFWDLRVEIHNYPSHRTLTEVQAFASHNDLGTEVKDELAVLIAELQSFLGIQDNSRNFRLNDIITGLPANPSSKDRLRQSAVSYDNSSAPHKLKILENVRKTYLDIKGPNSQSETRFTDYYIGDLKFSDKAYALSLLAFEDLKNSGFKDTEQLEQVILSIIEHTHLDDLITATQGHDYQMAIREIFLAQLEPTRRLELLTKLLGNLQDLVQTSLHKKFGAHDISARMTIRTRYPDMNLASFTDNLMRSRSLYTLGLICDLICQEVQHNKGFMHHVAGQEFSAPVDVMNPGTATGILRFNPDPLTLHPGDIAVFENIPVESGPSSAFITFGTGARLSHLQLLSKSLGIPNISVDETYTDVLKSLDGKTIHLEVLPAGNITITEQDTIHHSESHQPKMVTVPEPNLDIWQATSFEHAHTSGKRIAGPKGLTLAAMRSDENLKEHIPDGLILPFGFFDRFITTTSIKKYIEDLAKTNVNHKLLVSSRAGLIRKLIDETEIPDDMIDEIMTGMRELKKKYAHNIGYFFRSDTNIEDLDHFNGAGLNESVGNVPIVRDEVIKAIKKVWKSPFRENSINWRIEALNAEFVPIAIPSVVIHAHRSGQFFRRDPFKRHAALATRQGT